MKVCVGVGVVCGFCVVGEFWKEGEHVRVSCRPMYVERSGRENGVISRKDGLCE